MEARVVRRFRKKTVLLHWIHTAAFITLLVTGAILFLPGLGSIAAGGATRAIHRIAVIFFIVSPLVYFVMSPKMSWQFIKECFVWNKDDIKWVGKAPDYYFGGDEDKMFPQGHINTGQKMWQAIVVVTTFMFIVSGIVMWFFIDIIPSGLFQWTVVFHDIAFIVVFLMLLVHIYLGSIHPRMTESFSSMIDGKISKKYAQSHYLKWYEKMASGKGK